jgi:hypothetical protein
MDKDVSSVVLLDETISLGLIEPLNLSFERHTSYFLLLPYYGLDRTSLKGNQK